MNDQLLKQLPPLPPLSPVPFLSSLPNQPVFINPHKIHKECEFCLSVYETDIICVYDTQTICYHCLFWINFPPELRTDVFKNYGVKVEDYVAKCKDNHNVKTCVRQGSCVLCEHIYNNIVKELTDNNSKDQDEEQIEIFI